MHAAPDTIAAIATARGQAALAVLRVSGPDAIPLVAGCFRGRDFSAAPSHTVHVGFIAAADGYDLDQVVVALFRAPRSVTGEDVVEVTCHGGDFAPQLVLERLLQAGARLAQPGEFTQRAFLNGKMDLAQAEAVADLIHASSTLAHRVSLNHLQGRYSDVLERLRQELLETCAYVELELDFSEEDVAFADRARLEALLREAERLLRTLLQSYQIGEKVRDGVRVVIGGRPNAGKSTLLNALVGRERAIVSPTPGTTRDEIEAEAEIAGLRFRFVDTAGLRETVDAIEAEGVRRARHAIERADILLYLYDVTEGLDEGEAAFLRGVQAAQARLPIVLVANKSDLAGLVVPPLLDGVRFVALSSREALRATEVLNPLVAELLAFAGGDLSQADASPVVTNQRHRQHLGRALSAVLAARRALDEGAHGDTLALDLRAALYELGAITGRITNEDVLDQIFSRFCIGK